MRLREKVAVVTGTGSGIGRGIALRIAAEGSRVLATDLDLERAEETVRRIGASGGEAAALRLDVTARADHEAALAAALARFGRVDIWVNNAGISHVGNLEETTESDFDSIFRVNVRSMYYCMQACIGHMKDSGGGVILNLASIAASAGLADRFAQLLFDGAHDLLLGHLALESAQSALHLPQIADFLAQPHIAIRN